MRTALEYLHRNSVAVANARFGEKRWFPLGAAPGNSSSLAEFQWSSRDPSSNPGPAGCLDVPLLETGPGLEAS